MARSAAHSKLFAHATLSLIGLAWTAPFLQPYHRFPLPSFYSEWLAFALSLAACTWLLRRQTWREAGIPVVALAPLGLSVILGIQVALGRVPYGEQALTATLYLFWASLLVVLGHALKRECSLQTMAAGLSWFLLAGGLLGALAGILQYYQLSTPLDFLVTRKTAHQATGNLGQANHFASYLACGLVAMAYLYSRRRLHAALAAVCAALLLSLLAATASRSPWLYLAALAVLALLLGALRRDADTRRLATVALWLVPGFVAAQWVIALPLLAPPEGGPVPSLERLFQTASGVELRLGLWRQAWQMFLGSPILGAGFGQFAWHHFVELARPGAAVAGGVSNHAHNIVLQLMAETGLTGALMIAGPLLLWLTDLRRVEPGLEWWWLAALLAVVGIHSLLEYPLWYSYFLGMAALLVGFGAERVFVPRFAAAARAVAGLGIVAGWLNLVLMLPPYREFERLVFIPGEVETRPRDDAAFARAIVRLYREPLLVPYVELAIAYGVSVDNAHLRDKLALTARAMHFAPVPIAVYRHALLLVLAGEREAALAQLERALRVYPEEAANIAAELAALEGRYPGEFTPLIELATAKFAERRAWRGGK